MNPSLPMIVEALALRAEKDGTPQPVPPRMLRDIAEALKDLEYVGQHGEAWAQRIAREGRRATTPVSAQGS
jgi:hypothetical protein